MKLVIINLLACGLISSSVGKTSNPLKVTLYYESHCRASAVFITEQLYPVYKKIGPSLIVELVPYGNAHRKLVDGKWEIKCQHGEKECIFNTLQACALSRTTNQDDQVEFVYCVEKSIRDHKNLNQTAECGQKHGLQSTDLLGCVNGTEGVELLIREAEKTEALNPEHEYVPWVVFNDEYDEEMSVKWSEDFLKAACDLLDNKPDGCST